MQRLIVKQTARTEGLMILEPNEYKRSAYNWIDLGFVCRGHRNDEGIILVQMRIGLLKNLGAKVKHYPNEIVDVIEKYYGEQYGIRHNTPHLTERVLWRKPSNLKKLIKKYKGKDMRTKW
tara:strand:+ start:251 stop:610 length:360 start_codon:yes stop_codon:yes gene_type:complete